MAVEGLIIRRAEPTDAAAVHEIYSGRSAFAGTLQLPYPSLAIWQKRLSDPGNANYVLVAEVKGNAVGTISVSSNPDSPRRRHIGGIGMGVHEDWQSQGIGTAMMAAIVDLAENWLNLSRLELMVYTDNERAIRLYERFGFEREGTLRQYAFRDGVYVDAYYMARLRT